MGDGGLCIGLMGLWIGLVHRRGRVHVGLGYGVRMVIEGETVERAPGGRHLHLLLSCWRPLVKRVSICVDVTWSRGNVVVNGVSGITEMVKRLRIGLMGGKGRGAGYSENSRVAVGWFVWKWCGQKT